MKRLISGVPFSDCEYYPCGHVALDALLGFYGYSTPLALHDQWVFLYHKPQNGGLRVSPRLISETQSLGQLGIRVKVHKEQDVETAWEKVKTRIDKERPVAALLDTFHLERYYYPGLGHHSAHYVIVDGYDEASPACLADRQTVHVVDPSWIVQFRGDLPLSGFNEGWGSKHIPSYQWMEFRLPENRWNPTAGEVLKTIHRNLRFMSLNKAPAPGIYVGLNGLRKLADDLSRWEDITNGKASESLKMVYDQARFVIIERDGHGRYLTLTAEILDLPMLAEVGDALQTVTQKWIVFRNLCLKGHRRSRPETFEKLHQRLLEIASLEEKALNRLTAVVRA